MDEKQFNSIDEKMDKIMKLLALNLVSDAKGDDQIERLDAIGFRPGEIADLLGKGRNTVDQALHRIRKSKAKSKEMV